MLEQINDKLGPNPNSLDYAMYLKNIFGEEKSILPLWEIRTDDITYVLAWTRTGHEIYWFDGCNDSDSTILHKRLDKSLNDEDALYWTIGYIEYGGLNHEQKHKIKKLTRLGMRVPLEDTIKKNKVVFSEEV